MDFFERFSAKFGNWYEGLFGAGTGELRPRDVLRKITTAMEDHRKEGLDGKVYVPNRYILEIALDDPEERDYLLSFVDEEELLSVLERFMAQNHYEIRGPLDFTIEEIPIEARGANREKLRVKTRFEKGALPVAQARPPAPAPTPLKSPTLPPSVRAAGRVHTGPADDDDLPTVAGVCMDEDELGTVPAVAWGALAVTGVDGRKWHHSLTRPVTTIGRSRNAGNELVLSGDGMVSKQHARIERQPDGRFRLHDLGSTNGVTVNAARVEQSSLLTDGDEIVIGASHLVFQQTGERANRPTASAPVLPRASAGRAARLVGSPNIDHVLASDTLIGRGVTSDVVIDDPTISTRHARIVTSDGSTYFIEDMGSDHGTKINGRVLAPHQRALLANGDVIVIGTRVVQFVGTG